MPLLLCWRLPLKTLHSIKISEAMVGTSVKTKRGRKFDQVLEGARKVFMQDGYEGAAVDEIAREAGVSKATLYSYFPDKRMLFAEIAAIECRRQADASIETADVSRPPEINLPIAGRKIVDFILSDIGQSIQRIGIAESLRFPEIGQKFYDSGPAMLHNQLATYLQLCIDRQELEIDDVDLAAEQFSDLCKVRIGSTSSLLVTRTYDQVERDKIVDSAVAMFLARYGVSR